LTAPSTAQNKIQCGLITNFSLTPTSKINAPVDSDIKLLNAINNDLKVSSYMNKVINEGTRKIIVSLFTSGKYEDYLSKMSANKLISENKKTFNKKGVLFTCYNFKYSDKTVLKIVYNEPQLTLCVIFDVIFQDSAVDSNKVYDEIMNRISFMKSN
jgi:hypothetical protein